MECSHVSKVLEWDYHREDGQMTPFASKYGCTKCDATNDKPFDGDIYTPVDHSNCKDDPCFGCKAKGLVLDTGVAKSNGVPTAKAHDKELGSYYDAVRQGIEPVSTKQKDIDAAVAASNTAGKAFDGNTMGFKD